MYISKGFLIDVIFYNKISNFLKAVKIQLQVTKHATTHCKCQMKQSNE